MTSGEIQFSLEAWKNNAERNAKRAEFAEAEVEWLEQINADLLEALELTLPLAKGYAAAHKVGSNAAYVATAEAALLKAQPPSNSPEGES